MKNLHTPTPANAPSTTHARGQAFMAILGIMAAIVCGLILLQDAPTLPHMGTNKLGISEVSNLMTMVRIASSW